MKKRTVKDFIALYAPEDEEKLVLIQDGVSADKTFLDTYWAAHALILRVIQHHVTDSVIAVYTGNALITDIGDRQHTSIGQIGRIKELQVRLRNVGYLPGIAAFQIDFVHLPSTCRIQCCKHQAFPIPVQHQVGHGGTVYCRFINRLFLKVSAFQAGQFHQFRFKILTAGRAKIRPVVRPEKRKPSGKDGL